MSLSADGVGLGRRDGRRRAPRGGDRRGGHAAVRRGVDPGRGRARARSAGLASEGHGGRDARLRRPRLEGEPAGLDCSSCRGRTSSTPPSRAIRCPTPTGARFAFHFQPGLSSDERVARVTKLLGPAARGPRGPRRRSGRSCRRLSSGTRRSSKEIDRLSAGRRLCVLGNWFAGLSIEDCVDRSRSEWARVARGEPTGRSREA